MVGVWLCILFFASLTVGTILPMVAGTTIGSDLYSTGNFDFFPRLPDECLARDVVNPAPNLTALVGSPPWNGVNSIELVKYLSNSSLQCQANPSVRDTYVNTFLPCLQQVGLLSNSSSSSTTEAPTALCHQGTVLGSQQGCSKFDEIFVFGHDSGSVAMDFYQSPLYASCQQQAGFDCSIDYREVVVTTVSNVGKSNLCFSMSQDMTLLNATTTTTNTSVFRQSHETQAEAVAAAHDFIPPFLQNPPLPTNFSTCTDPAYLKTCGSARGTPSRSTATSILANNFHPRPDIGYGIVNVHTYRKSIAGITTPNGNSCVGLRLSSFPSLPNITADMTGRQTYQVYAMCIFLSDRNYTISNNLTTPVSWVSLQNGNLSGNVTTTPPTTLVGNVQYEDLILVGYTSRQIFQGARVGPPFEECGEIRECALEYAATYAMDGGICAGDQCVVYNGVPANTAAPSSSPVSAMEDMPSATPSMTTTTTTTPPFLGNVSALTPTPSSVSVSSPPPSSSSSSAPTPSSASSPSPFVVRMLLWSIAVVAGISLS